MTRCAIIGGVAAGTAAAARLRRLDEDIEILLFERGNHISYASCGLPYFIGETITKRKKLFVQTPEKFAKRFNIDVRTENEVLKIERGKKLLKVRNLNTDEEYEEYYDKLIIATGTEPVKPPLQGINHPRIFTVKNVPDTDRIKEFIEQKEPRRAVIIGGGFIGLEMAENLNDLGIFVTIVEMASQVMTPLDYEMAAEVQHHLKTKKVEFYLNDAVDYFEEKDDLVVTKTKSGKCIVADMVVLSIGVKPESRLASEAGLQVGPRGGVVVDEHLHTTDPDIFAIGDVIEFPHPLINKSYSVYLAGPAAKQGRMVADNIILGDKEVYTGSLATAIAKVFDLTVASTGLSEKLLIAEDIPYVASITHSPNHAGYYPGAEPMSIKILFSPKDGRIFGAQIVGYKGVDKRIDLFSALISLGGKISDLTTFEHAYAPPYSSAKDPVNMAGFVAENILENRVRICHWRQIEELKKEGAFFLDVRTPREVEGGTIQGSANIPIDDLRDRLDEIPKDRKIIIFCAVGLRGYFGARILTQHGFEDVYNLSGGWKTFQLATMEPGNEDIFEKECVGVNDEIYRCRG